MKLISWNVNGIRACLTKGFEEVFKKMDADIFCLQETKCQPDQINLEFQGYTSYWNRKKGIFRYCNIYKTKTNKCNIWNRDRRT